MQFNRDKFTAAVHYVCRKFAMEPEKLGKTKLHKILWLSDIWHYRQYGDPLTGATYIKMPYGPFAQALSDTLSLLEKSGNLYSRKVDVGEFEKFELIGKGDPDMSAFSKSEMMMLEEAANYVAENHTAGSISDKTHDEVWEMADLQEAIPYEAMIASPAKITEEHFAWVRSEIAKH